MILSFESLALPNQFTDISCPLLCHLFLQLFGCSVHDDISQILEHLGSCLDSALPEIILDGSFGP